MSGYQPTYVPGDGSPSGGQNPESPWSTAQTLDLKTNVNRQKTKRWVNAKKYSYAGDDWGDSEDDEEEDQPSTTTAADAQSPNILRPADIYKRLAEEREKDQSGSPAEAAGAPSGSIIAAQKTAQLPEASRPPAGPESSAASTQMPNAHPEPPIGQLPELRRLSGFDGFMGSGDELGTTTADVQPREPLTDRVPTIREEHVGDNEPSSTSAHNATPTLSLSSPEPTDQTTVTPTEHGQGDHTPSDHRKSTALDSPDTVDATGLGDTEPHAPSLRERSTISEDDSEGHAAALDVSPLSMSKRSSIDPSTVPSTMADPTDAALPREHDGFQQNEKADLAPAVTSPEAKQYPSTQLQDNPSPLGMEPPRTTITIPHYNPQPSSYEQQQPERQLKKKFSWEADSEESDRDQALSPLSPVSATLTPGALVINKQPTGTENEPSSLSAQFPQPPSAEPPQNTAVAETQRETDLAKSQSPPHSVAFQGQPSVPPPDADRSNSPVSNQKAPEFREITSIPQPTQRIAAFNNARNVYADTDTGLDRWIKHVVDTGHPDNAETIQRNGVAPADSNAAHRPVPSQAKFPKLSSLGNISLPTRHHDGSGPTHGHVRQSSGVPLSGMMNTQHVQAKGKDLLHSAGVLGGKAGDAAKGLFAKGRSKFRYSGSADKGQILPPTSPPLPHNIVQTEFESPRPSIGSQYQRNQHQHQHYQYQHQQQPQPQPQHQYQQQQQQQQQQPSLTIPETIPRVKSLKFDSQPFSVSFMGEMAHIMSNSNNDEKKPRDSKRYSGRGLALITEEHANPSVSESPGQGDISNGQMTPVADELTQSPAIPEIHLPTSTVDIETVSVGKGSIAVSALADEKDIERGRHSFTVSEVDMKPTREPSIISSADTLDNSKQIEVGNVINNGGRDQVRLADASQTQMILSRRFSFELEPETSQLTGSPLPAGHQDPSIYQATNGHATQYSFPPPRMSNSSPTINEPSQQPSHPTHPAHSRTWTQTDQRSVSPLPVVHKHTDTNGSGLSFRVSSAAHEQPAGQQANGNATNYYYSQAGAGCPDPGVYQPPLEEQKKRRASLGLTGIMSKVNMVRNKGEQAERPSSPVLKKGGKMFKTLKFDLLHGKNKSHRHASSDSADPGETAPAASYNTRQYHSVGSRVVMQRNTPSALSNHNTVNSSTHYLNTGVYDGPSPPPVDTPFSPDRILSPDRAFSPDGAISPSRTQSPSPSANGSRWNSNPSSPEDFSGQTTGSRSGRFYTSINSFLPRLPEPSDTPQISRQPSPSKEPSSSLRDGIPGASSGPSSATIPSGASFVSNNNFNSTPPPLPHSINSPTSSEQTSKSPAHSPHIKDLHFRSRSPLSRPPDNTDSSSLFSDTHDPAQRLGTFHSSVPHTPRVGDQETPWTITLPQDEQEPPAPGTAHHPACTSPGLRRVSCGVAGVSLTTSPPKGSLNGSYSYFETRPTLASHSIVGPSGEPSNGAHHPTQTRLVHVASMEPVELPANDDSSEEIVMSSTSYPGQEWQPAYLGQWD